MAKTFVNIFDKGYKYEERILGFAAMNNLVAVDTKLKKDTHLIIR